MGRSRHRFSPSIVRPDGLSGSFGGELSLADAEVLGRAFGTLVRKQGGHRIVVGFDGRISSPDLATALSMGLVTVGAQVFRAGRCPTPMLRFGMRHLGCDAGVMVTTSSDAPEFNGLRLFVGRAPCDATQMEQIARIAADGAFLTGSGRRKDVALLEAYAGELLEVAGETPSFKVVWDAGNGATGDALRFVVRHLPDTNVLINEVVDGRFPNRPPDSLDVVDLVQLKTLLATGQFDVGVALDGDGDRLVVMERGGRIVGIDSLALLLAETLPKRKRTVTVILDERIDEAVQTRIRTLDASLVLVEPDVALIERKLMETGAVLGAHLNGHLIFGDGDVVRHDAIYTALRLRTVLARGAS